MNEEVRLDAQRFHCRQHDRRPAVMIHARARVVSGMRAVTVIVTLLARRNRHADFDRRIHRLHLCEVLRRVGGVSVRIVRARVGIGFPRAVTLIADFPIFKIATIGDIRRTHPRGGFAGCAGAVIGSDDGLRAHVRRQMHEAPK